MLADARLPTSSPPTRPEPGAGDDDGPRERPATTATAAAPTTARTPGWRTTLANQDRGARSLSSSAIGRRGGTSASWTASPHWLSTARCGSKSARRSRRRTSRRWRVRQRASGAAEGVEGGQGGQLRPRGTWSLEEQQPERGEDRGHGDPERERRRAHHGARASATRRAARRRAGELAPSRRRRRDRCPPVRTGRRRHGDPSSGRASPGRGRRRRRRTWSPSRRSARARSRSRSEPASGTARASVIRSYWPWSGFRASAGRAGVRRGWCGSPARAAGAGSAASRCLGPTIAGRGRAAPGVDEGDESAGSGSCRPAGPRGWARRAEQVPAVRRSCGDVGPRPRVSVPTGHRLPVAVRPVPVARRVPVT